MRTFTILIAALALLAAVAPARAVKLNTPAPGFTLTDLHGAKQSLAAQRGRVVILNFWSTSCAPCVAELPALNKLHHDLRQDGLTVLGIALDQTDAPVRELATKLKLTFPLMLDSDKDVYFDSYALFGQPVSIIIDRSGTVREQLVGPVEWGSRQVRDNIGRYLKGR